MINSAIIENIIKKANTVEEEPAYISHIKNLNGKVTAKCILQTADKKNKNNAYFVREDYNYGKEKSKSKKKSNSTTGF